MTPSRPDPEIIAERSAWVREMIASIRALPLDSFESFAADRRNEAAAESYLRRGLEALLDLGRHVLARGFGRATAEYKEIADTLVEVGVLDAPAGALLREMEGYRNHWSISRSAGIRPSSRSETSRVCRDFPLMMFPRPLTW